MNDHCSYVCNLAIGKGKPEKKSGLNGIGLSDVPLITVQFSTI